MEYWKWVDFEALHGQPFTKKKEKQLCRAVEIPWLKALLTKKTALLGATKLAKAMINAHFGIVLWSSSYFGTQVFKDCNIFAEKF